MRKKEKDTADRTNGLERPKPNEGYALGNGVSNTKIPQNASGVNEKETEPPTTAASHKREKRLAILFPIKDYHKFHFLSTRARGFESQGTKRKRITQMGDAFLMARPKGL